MNKYDAIRIDKVLAYGSVRRVAGGSKGLTPRLETAGLPGTLIRTRR